MHDGIGMEVQIEQHNPDQHQHRARQGVQHVLQGGILALRTGSPQLEQEIRGNQHQLPEYEKQNEIERGKHAHDGPLQREQGHEVGLEEEFAGFPGIHHD